MYISNDLMLRNRIIDLKLNLLLFVYSSNDAPFGEYGVTNVVLRADTTDQLISRTLNFDIIRSGGNIGTTQVTVNITHDQVVRVGNDEQFINLLKSCYPLTLMRY